MVSLVEKFVPGTHAPDEDQDDIVQEWTDVQVAVDLPEFYDVDIWWGNILQRKKCSGQVMHGYLTLLVTTLLILPYVQAPVQSVHKE